MEIKIRIGGENERKMVMPFHLILITFLWFIDEMLWVSAHHLDATWVVLRMYLEGWCTLKCDLFLCWFWHPWVFQEWFWSTTILWIVQWIHSPKVESLHEKVLLRHFCANRQETSIDWSRIHGSCWVEWLSITQGQRTLQWINSKERSVLKQCYRRYDCTCTSLFIEHNLIYP